MDTKIIIAKIKHRCYFGIKLLVAFGVIILNFPFTAKSAPNAPSNLSSEPKPQVTINLKWQDNSSDESYFKFYRSTSETSGYTFFAKRKANETEYNYNPIIALDEGVKYYFRICAVVNNVCSEFSNIASATTFLYTPQYLYASINGDNKIILNWTDKSNKESNYIIERQIDSGSWLNIASLPSGSQTYEDNYVQTATHTYYYRVKAVDSGNGLTSDYSNIALAQSPKEKPDLTLAGIPPIVMYSSDVAFINQTAYVTSPITGIVSIDITDPLNAKSIGTLQPYEKNITKISTNGNIALLHNTDNIPILADISNPAAMKVISRLDSSSSVALKGNYIFLSYVTGFKVIDISNPSNPQVIKKIPLTGFNLSNLKIKDNLLLFSQSNKFVIYDITDPTLPVLGGSVDVGASIYDIKAETNTAIILTATELKTIALENINFPTVLGSVAINKPSHLVLKNNFAYLSNNSQQVHVVDYRDRQSPSITYTYYVNLHGESIGTFNNYLLSANGKLWDITDPILPQYKGNYIFGEKQSNKIAVTDKIAIVDYNQEVIVLDISNPNNITYLATISNQVFTDFTIKNNLLLYATRTDGDFYPKSLVIYDLSEPQSPLLLKTLRLADFEIINISADDTSNIIAIEGNNSSSGNCETRLYDIGNPVNPVYQQTLNLCGPALIDNNYLFINNADNFKIFNISQVPAVVVGSISISPYNTNNMSVRAIQKHNNYIYFIANIGKYEMTVLGYEDRLVRGILAIDVSNFSMPQITGNFLALDTDTRLEPNDFVIGSNNFLYYVTGDSTFDAIVTLHQDVSIIDISDPDNLLLVKRFRIEGINKSIAINNGVIYSSSWKYLVEAYYENKLWSDRLTIFKSANLSSVSPGQNITYTIEINNPTDSVFNNINVEDPLTGLIYLSSTCSPDCNNQGNYSGGKVIWDIGTLSPNDQKTLTLVVKVE